MKTSQIKQVVFYGFTCSNSDFVIVGATWPSSLAFGRDNSMPVV